MPQYLLSVHYVEGEGATERTLEEADAPEADMQQAFEQVEAFNQKLQANGSWVFAGGLHTPDMATVVDASKGGDAIITDGPFSEAKEQIGGFWVIRCEDLDQALYWADKCALACGRPIEVRPFDDGSED